MKNNDNKPFKFFSAFGLLIEGQLIAIIPFLLIFIPYITINHENLNKDINNTPIFIIALIIATLFSNIYMIKMGKKRAHVDNFSLQKVKSYYIIPSIIITLAIGLIMGETTALLNLPDILSFDKMPLLTKLVLGVLFAPIFEELIFRGIILQGFLKNYSENKAIIFSAILFGMIHFNPAQIPGAFVIGLFFGWLTIKTNSLLPTILLHALNNFIAFSPDLFPQLKSSFIEAKSIYSLMPNHSLYYGLMVLIMTFGFVAFGYLLNKKLKE